MRACEEICSRMSVQIPNFSPVLFLFFALRFIIFLLKRKTYLSI